MKTHYFIAGMVLGLIGMSACGNQKQTQETPVEAVATWDNYPVGHIVFDDQAPQTEGSKIYHRIVTDPQSYIAEQARAVLATLYEKNRLRKTIRLSCFLRLAACCSMS